MSYTYVWDLTTEQISTQIIQRDLDNAFIPNDMGNADWLEYQAWLLAGNTPNPPTIPEPTPPVDPLPVPPAQAYQELQDLTVRVDALEQAMVIVSPGFKLVRKKE